MRATTRHARHMPISPRTDGGSEEASHDGVRIISRADVNAVRQPKLQAPPLQAVDERVAARRVLNGPDVVLVLPKPG